MSAIPAAEPDRYMTEMTEAEYLEFEEDAETKHEFVDGYVYNWAGYDYDPQGLAGTRRMHSRLQFNFVLAVGPAARAAGCVVNGSDMRLRIRLPYTRRYYYPDATVLCDQEIREAEGDDEMHITRPCIVVEILSRRTARIDRTEKLEVYQSLPSVQAYLIVHQQQQRVEYHRRAEDGSWQPPALLGADDTLQLPCINASLRVADLYV